jgi:hypothetical protein
MRNVCVPTPRLASLPPPNIATTRAIGAPVPVRVSDNAICN